MNRNMIVASGGTGVNSLRVRLCLGLAFVCAVLASSLSAVPSVLAADSTARISYGLYAQFHLMDHSAAFNELPGFPKAPALFDGGDGSGIAAGAVIGIPAALFLGDAEFLRKLHLDLRAGVELHDATLETDEPTFVNLRSGERAPGNFRHTIDANFQTLSLTPLLRYELFSNFSVQAGPQIGLSMGADFDQRQTLTEPAEATLLNLERNVDLYSADIPDPTSPALALRVGLGYEFELNEQWSAALEASFRTGLGDVAADLDWQSSAIELGAVLRFMPPASIPPVRDTIYQRDTVFQQNTNITQKSPAVLQNRSLDSDVRTVAEREFITLKITESYVQDLPAQADAPEVEDEVIAAAQEVNIALDVSLRMQAGADSPNSSGRNDIEVEESIATRYTPLLNYIFFDQNSSALPPRYVQLTRGNRSQFYADSLYASSTLETYYNVLNVLGSRMQAESAGSLRLLGHGDSAAETDDLARARALTVRDYLMRVWDVDPARIKIETRSTPRRPSNDSRPEGLAENRRVEILADIPGLLEPLFLSNTVYRSAAESMQFQPRIQGLENVQQWRLTLGQGAFPLWDTLGAGMPPVRINVSLDEKLLTRLRTEAIDCILEVRAEDGKAYNSDVKSLKLRINTRREQLAEGQGVTEVERYSLLLFDFDDVRLSDENREILEFINSRLRPGARVRIIGKTDAVGDAAYNRSLSSRRAQSVAAALGIDNAEILGLGEDHGGISNTLPEGRFYNRTVVVEIESLNK